jgi:hypothetical protein
MFHFGLRVVGHSESRKLVTANHTNHAKGNQRSLVTDNWQLTTDD